MNIMHNDFVTQVAASSSIYGESAQKMVDTIHAHEKELAAVR